VQNRDTLIMTIAATIGGAISMLAQFGLFFGGARNNGSPFGFIGIILMVILAPIAAGLIQMAISRSREYKADELGAEICQRPMWLASALEKIAGAAKQIQNQRAERNPATAHMFIINPLAGLRMDSLFSTHPPTEERISRLQAMAREMGRGGGVSEAEGGPWGARSEGPWS